VLRSWGRRLRGSGWRQRAGPGGQVLRGWAGRPGLGCPDRPAGPRGCLPHLEPV